MDKVADIFEFPAMTGGVEAFGLDPRRVGYWVAQDPRTGEVVKSYFDLKYHPEITRDVLRGQLLRGGASMRRLGQAIALLPSFSPSVLQFRQNSESEIEAKAYLAAPDQGSARDASFARLARFGASKGNPAELHESLIRRDKACPTFYCGIAFRPGIEIETYHEAPGSKPFDLALLRELLEAFSLNTPVRALATQMWTMARSCGMSCSQVACDLVSDSGEVSLHFDPDDPGDQTAIDRMIVHLGFDPLAGSFHPEEFVEGPVAVKLTEVAGIMKFQVVREMISARIAATN